MQKTHIVKIEVEKNGKKELFIFKIEKEVERDYRGGRE